MSTSRIKEELVKKYLLGKADEHEKRLVEGFMQHDEAQALFSKVWEDLHSEMMNPSPSTVSDPVRMETWKSHLRQKIEHNHVNPPITRTQKSRLSFWRYAAIWLSLMLVGSLWGSYLFFDRQGQEYSTMDWVTHHNPNGQKSVIRLSDSTMVYLGAASSLRYPKRFKGDKREVHLEGEAFFDVAKDPEKRFLVISDDIVTQVLGTSFKVESFDRSPLLVSVSTGLVRVAQVSGSAERVLADLTAGQYMKWDEQVAVVKTIPAQQGAEDFMGGKLVFDDSPLAEIVKAIERNYNVRIDIQRSSLVKKHIRITLERNLALKQVMDVLSAVGEFRYRLDRDKGQIDIY